MCPLCLATFTSFALGSAGLAAVGGLGLRVLGKQRRTQPGQTATQPATEGSRHEQQ